MNFFLAPSMLIKMQAAHQIYNRKKKIKIHQFIYDCIKIIIYRKKKSNLNKKLDIKMSPI